MEQLSFIIHDIRMSSLLTSLLWHLLRRFQIHKVWVISCNLVWHVQTIEWKILNEQVYKHHAYFETRQLLPGIQQATTLSIKYVLCSWKVDKHDRSTKTVKMEDYAHRDKLWLPNKLSYERQFLPIMVAQELKWRAVLDLMDTILRNDRARVLLFAAQCNYIPSTGPRNTRMLPVGRQKIAKIHSLWRLSTVARFGTKSHIRVLKTRHSWPSPSLVLAKFIDQYCGNNCRFKFAVDSIYSFTVN